MAMYKANDPLAVYTLTLDKPEESYVANVVLNQLQEDFRGQEKKVSKLSLSMVQYLTFIFYASSI
jgi:hypothetical protein